MGAVGGFISLAFAIVFGIIGFAVFAVLYCLLAVGLYKLAEKRGFADKRMLAWIPFANFYLLGLIIPEITLFGQKLRPLHVILPVCAIAAAFGVIPLIGRILPLAFYALISYVSFEVMKDCDRENTILYAVFWPVGYFLLYR